MKSSAAVSVILGVMVWGIKGSGVRLAGLSQDEKDLNQVVIVIREIFPSMDTSLWRPFCPQLPSSWQLTSSAPLDSGPDSLVERLSSELPSSSTIRVLVLGFQVLCGTLRGIVIAVISICWSLFSHSLQSWTGSDIPPVVFLRGVVPTAWLLSNQYFNNRIMISHLERITYSLIAFSVEHIAARLDWFFLNELWKLWIIDTGEEELIFQFEAIRILESDHLIWLQLP